MDPFSHGLVGGLSAALFKRTPAVIPVAVLAGALSGMAPDLDILIRDSSNPMFGLKYHRFFTHSLVFAPFGSLAMALALYVVLRKRHRFTVLYISCLIGMLMHGILDAMTNYGTHLFWPFTMRRESWSIISIIDPIFTLTLLVFLVLTVKRRLRRYAVYASIFAMSYWSLGLYQRENATQVMHQVAQSRRHAVERLEVKPSIGNIIVWRTQYLHQGRIYTDAVHVSPWVGSRLYEGGSLALYIPTEPISPTQKKDLEYFTFFSDGWLAHAPALPDVIGDARFSMLPQQMDPLWGIRLKPDKPDAHVDFVQMRTRTSDDFARLWHMIQGREL